MMIFVYWGILILCYFIASRLRSMASRFGFLDKSMMGAVYILVFLMGLRMGINQQVTSALATIGVQALAITLAAIGGSILMIFLVRKALRLNRYGGSEKDAQEQEHRGKAGTSDLKSTVGIVLLVIAGIAVGRFGLVDQFPDHLEEISNITGNGLTIFLCVLIAIIGFDLGLSGTVAANLKSVGLKVLAFPLAILAGTMLAGGSGPWTSACQSWSSPAGRIRWSMVSCRAFCSASSRRSPCRFSWGSFCKVSGAGSAIFCKVVCF